MNNIFDVLSKLQAFKAQLNGQNPQALLDQLLSSGKVTQEQIDEAKKKAEAIISAFNIN